MLNKGQQQSKRLWGVFGVWVIWGAVFTPLAWRAFRYGQRLWRQPRLVSRPIPAAVKRQVMVEVKEKVMLAGMSIVTANLRAGMERRRLLNGQEKLVLCAGLRNFREPWARDLGFACFGLVALGEFEVVEEALEAFLLYQKPSGQFPVKLHSTNIVERYLHSIFKREQPTEKPLRPKYMTAHNTVSLDGNALIVAAILNYARQRDATDFIRTHWSALKQAMAWLEKHALADDGLLHQAPFADWADSIARAGRVLYTNVLYWKALTDLAQAAATTGLEEDRCYFAAKSEQVKVSINRHFWRADLGYYVTSEVFDNLSSSGNLLAVSWGLTTPEQALAILDKMQEFKMAHPVPTQAVHRAYPVKFIALENRLGGIPYYHTSAAWLWLGAWHIIALTRMGRLEEAEALLYRLMQVVVRDGAVHEIYALNGHYVSTFWYTSEAPLTWSAGMVAYAHQVYHQAWSTIR